MRFYRSDIADVSDELAAAYEEVFTAPPWSEEPGASKEFTDRLAVDRLRPGFRAVVAPSPAGVDGFVTGWITQAPFPHGRSYDKVAAQLGPHTRQLVVGAYEINEVAVRPGARRTGLGGRLLAAAVEAAAPDGRAWLLTARFATDTVNFYRRRGWHEITPPPGADSGAGSIAVFLAPDHPEVPAHRELFTRSTGINR
ncbi:GNAT family N-acetyltransferase [Streptomyces sp. NPDC048442]|uniref:GNAT family N-acetyltransferase n=1 Tax=Streptomyces sp. NPDC048442 TaxID=3154823 RepID=UPI003435D872